MPSKLRPIESGWQTVGAESAGETFAILERSRLELLARSMSACSAVLICLEWYSALQQKMSRGPLAGQRVARVSAGTLIEITGRPLRTIRWALAELKRKGLIETVENEAGKTAIYRVATTVS